MFNAGEHIVVRTVRYTYTYIKLNHYSIVGFTHFWLPNHLHVPLRPLPTTHFLWTQSMILQGLKRPSKTSSIQIRM